MARAIRPYSELNATIIPRNVIIDTILLYRTLLLFSWPSNFDVKILVNVIGIIQKLIILTVSIIAEYSEKKIGMMRGATKNPNIEIPIEMKTAYFFNFLFSSPWESCGSVNLKIINVNIIPTLTSCCAKENSPRIPNPRIGTMRNLFTWTFNFVSTSIT